MIIDFDVGKVSFELVNDRPQFENEINCPHCGALTLELTETGQTELTEIYLKDVKLEDSEEED